MMATAMAVAFIVYSCKGKLAEAESLNIDETPVQTVDNMFIVQTKNSEIQMRAEAPRMEKYENDSLSYELFPKGFFVYGYDETGKMLIANLKKAKVNTKKIVKLKNINTGNAFITVDKNGENSIVVASGANGKLTKEMIDKNISMIKAAKTYTETSAAVFCISEETKRVSTKDSMIRSAICAILLG